MAEDVIYDHKSRFLDAKEEPNRWLTPIEGYEEKALVSLEESVQRIKNLAHDEQTKKLVGERHIQNLIENLDKNIWIAKNNSRILRDGLTEDESAAVHLYTMQWIDSDDNLCTILNKILRSEKRDILKPWFSYLKLILTALYKLPAKKRIIWRGIRGNVSDQYQLEKVWWGFSSCTETMSQIDQFLGKCDERTMFMIDCINGKTIRNHSKFPDENEILLMPGSFFRVIDKHSPAKDLYIIHLQETIAPYELLKAPYLFNPPSTVPAAISAGSSPNDSTDAETIVIELHEIVITAESEAMMETEMNAEYLETYRLFYIDHGRSPNDAEYKIVIDSENMAKVIQTLHQLNPAKQQLFGIFGEEIGLKTSLYSLFPNHFTQINPMFAGLDPMPAIWVVYNNMKIVFSLIPSHNTSSEKGNDYMIIMQRFLQDICRTILICPSGTFFSKFSIEHSFHGKPHETRIYRQVKKERNSIQSIQNFKLNDKNISKTLLHEHYEHILITNNTPNTYSFQKYFVEITENVMDRKCNELKQLLDTHLRSETLTANLVSNHCQQYGIFLSKIQQSQIEHIVLKYLTNYNEEKLQVNNKAQMLIKELLYGRYSVALFFSTASNNIDTEFGNHLYGETTNWLINPAYTNEIAQQFSSRLTEMIRDYGSKKNVNIEIKPERCARFISELRSVDRKTKIRMLQEELINNVRIVVTSEKQFKIHYEIQQLRYDPTVNTKNDLQCLNIARLTPIQFSFNDLNDFINVSGLSESDRRKLSEQLECVACFKMSDDRGEIIVMRTSKIVNKRLYAGYGYIVLSHINGTFKKIFDLSLKTYVVYASDKKSQTLILYHIATGKTTRCLINEFGHVSSSCVLNPSGWSKRPSRVKSLTLTVAQDLLILIDHFSHIFEFDISKENITQSLSPTKMTKNWNYRANLTADNGQSYEIVQTIGEKNPIFFFLAKSCIDIYDQTYCQLHSIKRNQNTQVNTMQIFTNFTNTYCVLLDAQVNEVYCMQNLLSDTHIERQRNSDNLEKSTKQYIGNQLLDIIKRGEIQFGAPDSLDETEYHFILSPEYSKYDARIRRYFKSLNLSAQLEISDQKPNLLHVTMHNERLSKILMSRVPIQLCTIEMDTLIPLINDKRDRMDHLSSQSTPIDQKANEISFSYFDDLLNSINENENLRIVGIIGPQSTEKNYLLNKTFRTRFFATAGQYTDGIWMSYAFLENTHFIILDCEGFFSDQRTENEEIKLIAFLAAVCDITILNQDSGFNRFYDRFFTVLSQATDKLAKTDKLFKGILLVTVPDITDYNADESLEAIERRFLDLQIRGQSSFLDQLFSKTFKIQLLHHFENKNFDYDIEYLRKLCVDHTAIDSITGEECSRRWKKGKDLADYLKILLVQLYTDDCTNSNEIHYEMKLAELDEEMRKAWTTFIWSGKENIELAEQRMEKKFENKLYSFKFNHTNLKLDENSPDRNLNNIREFILTNYAL